MLENFSYHYRIDYALVLTALHCLPSDPDLWRTVGAIYDRKQLLRHDTLRICKDPLLRMCQHRTKVLLRGSLPLASTLQVKPALICFVHAGKRYFRLKAAADKRSRCSAQVLCIILYLCIIYIYIQYNLLQILCIYTYKYIVSYILDVWMHSHAE